jgi:hypothetical protein
MKRSYPMRTLAIAVTALTMLAALAPLAAHADVTNPSDQAQYTSASASASASAPQYGGRAVFQQQLNWIHRLEAQH